MTEISEFHARIWRSLAWLIIACLAPITGLSFYLQSYLTATACLAALVTLIITPLADKLDRPLLFYGRPRGDHLPLSVPLFLLGLAYVMAVRDWAPTSIFFGYLLLCLYYALLEARQSNVFATVLIVMTGSAAYAEIGISMTIVIMATMVLLAIFAYKIRQLAVQLARHLQSQSVTDPLTGALNRRMMEKTLQECTSRLGRYQSPSVIITVDLDNFKTINDLHGHLVGDSVLQTVVSIMGTRTRQLDKVFRTGGDEFLLVLPDTSENNAKKLAQELEKLVTDNPLMSRYHASISMGICQLLPTDTVASWLERCDKNLYLAKDIRSKRLPRKKASYR